jgi:hypothetical protein
MSHVRTWGGLAVIALALTACTAAPGSPESTSPLDSERPPVQGTVVVPAADKDGGTDGARLPMNLEKLPNYA